MTTILLAAMALAPQPPLEVGQKAPDVVLKDMDGKSVALSQFAGKKIIVFNWASW